jgi:hypothetical protein
MGHGRRRAMILDWGHNSIRPVAWRRSNRRGFAEDCRLRRSASRTGVSLGSCTLTARRRRAGKVGKGNRLERANRSLSSNVSPMARCVGIRIIGLGRKAAFILRQGRRSILARNAARGAIRPPARAITRRSQPPARHDHMLNFDGETISEAIAEVSRQTGSRV